MFPKSKVNVFYRVLCMLAYMGVVLFIDSKITLIILMIGFFIYTINEKKVENIYLYVATIVSFVMCLTIGYYFLLRIMVFFDYMYYFLSAPSYDDLLLEEEIDTDQKYIRFKEIKKKKKKEDNNMLCTIFVTVHMVVLLLAIVVG